MRAERVNRVRKETWDRPDHLAPTAVRVSVVLLVFQVRWEQKEIREILDYQGPEVLQGCPDYLVCLDSRVSKVTQVYPVCKGGGATRDHQAFLDLQENL